MVNPGTRLGAYEILSSLGAGGMGEVYRAVDSNLGRHVAIKVLPDAFAEDPERLSRFDREARTLAALNHPNIAAIYGLERSASGTALVMELVEGPTLADRIALGAIPLDEAIPIATQIAEALEAAHDHNIIHRDLKPANIKVRPDGTVKVLDFGLAKLNDRNVPTPTCRCRRADGAFPKWRADGRALFYQSLDGQVMMAPIAASRTDAQAGVPVAIFRPSLFGSGTDINLGRQWDLAPDGRFLTNIVRDVNSSLVLV